MPKRLTCLADERKEIAPEKACIIIRADKKQEQVVVDVGTSGEYEEGRLPESKSIPLIELG